MYLLYNLHDFAFNNHYRFYVVKVNINAFQNFAV